MALIQSTALVALNTFVLVLAFVLIVIVGRPDGGVEGQGGQKPYGGTYGR